MTTLSTDPELDAWAREIMAGVLSRPTPPPPTPVRLKLARLPTQAFKPDRHLKGRMKRR